MPETNPRLFTHRTLSAAAGLMLGFVLLLVVEGRPLWCKYGLGIWADAWTHCTSQHLLDPYTLSHVLHGIVFFWLIHMLARRIALHQKVLIGLILEVGWEVLENSPWVIQRYRQQTAALDYTGDTILNSVGDVIATMVGLVFAPRFSWKASLTVFIVFELWMLYLARDSLTLNVVMLLFPSQTLQEWQLRGI